MHPELLRILGRWHDRELIEEAATDRLASHTRRSVAEPEPNVGNAPAWRRSIGWAFVDLGLRVAGGALPTPRIPAQDCR